jgi:hypothetical protein
VIARGAASAILIGAVLLGTTGCSLFSEKATLIEYDPGDGVSLSVGDVTVRNVLAISEDGTDVNLVLSAVNSSDKGIFVNLEYGDGAGEEQLYVAGNSSTSIGRPGDDTLVLKDADVEVGGLMPLYAQYGSHQGEQVLVPVLDASLPEYSTLAPIEPTSTPTGDPTPTPTPTVAPTDAPSE